MFDYELFGVFKKWFSANIKFSRSLFSIQSKLVFVGASKKFLYPHPIKENIFMKILYIFVNPNSFLQPK